MNAIITMREHGKPNDPNFIDFEGTVALNKNGDLSITKVIPNDFPEFYAFIRAVVEEISYNHMIISAVNTNTGTATYFWVTFGDEQK